MKRLKSLIKQAAYEPVADPGVSTLSHFKVLICSTIIWRFYIIRKLAHPICSRL